MKVLFFNTKQYDKEFFNAANQHHHHDIRFVDAKLSLDTVGRPNSSAKSANPLCTCV
jgi:lactate dehydrogenase-like 2-hydroxyacid dehydrogenase